MRICLSFIFCLYMFLCFSGKKSQGSGYSNKIYSKLAFLFHCLFNAATHIFVAKLAVWWLGSINILVFLIFMWKYQSFDWSYKLPRNFEGRNFQYPCKSLQESMIIASYIKSLKGYLKCKWRGMRTVKNIGTKPDTIYAYFQEVKCYFILKNQAF